MDIEHDPLPCESGSRSVIWLGDVIRAIDLLGPETDPVAIARVLGFEPESIDAPPKRPPSTSEPSETGESRSEDDKSVPTPVVGEREPEGAALAELEFVEPIGTVRRTVPRAAAADTLDVETEAHHERPRLHEPLFRDNWTRSIVTAALETPAPGGEVDVDALLGELSHARPVIELPRLPRPSLYRGAQVLLDIAESMEPFLRDQEELAMDIQQVVGTEEIEFLKFRGCPTRPDGAGSGALWTWEDYRLPDPGRPVLVLSDLGIGGPSFSLERAQVDEWLELASRLRKRGCRLVAFVPYPPDRWPAKLEATMTLFPWDRGTSRGTIRQVLGRIGR